MLADEQASADAVQAIDLFGLEHGAGADQRGGRAGRGPVSRWTGTDRANSSGISIASMPASKTAAPDLGGLVGPQAPQDRHQIAPQGWECPAHRVALLDGHHPEMPRA